MTIKDLITTFAGKSKYTQLKTMVTTENITLKTLDDVHRILGKSICLDWNTTEILAQNVDVDVIQFNCDGEWMLIQISDDDKTQTIFEVMRQIEKLEVRIELLQNEVAKLKRQIRWK